MPSNDYDESQVALEREQLRSYWEAYAEAPTIESMMLNAHAADVDESDRADVLDGLPANMTNMSVLEIGAGIGCPPVRFGPSPPRKNHKSAKRLQRTTGKVRFTKPLAERSREVLATDFIKSFVDKNEELHKPMGNVSFMTADAVTLAQDQNSRDMVFTNWLLMYLTDEEVSTFFFNCLRWLRPGGYMHMRESCTESSTRSKSTDASENPTHYRHVSIYIAMLRAIQWTDDKGQAWRLKPLWSRSINTYVFAKNNWRQCQLLIRKIPASGSIGHRAASTRTEVVNVARATHLQQEQLEARFENKLTNDNQVLERLTDMQDEGASITHVLNLAPKEVCSFEISQKLGCAVTTVSADPFEYAAFLTEATKRQNKKVRCTWSCFEDGGWKLSPACADIIICGEGPIPGDSAWFMRKLTQTMRPNAQFMFTSLSNISILNGLLNQFGVLTVVPCVLRSNSDRDSGSSGSDDDCKLYDWSKKLSKEHQSCDSLDSGITEFPQLSVS